MNIIGITAQAVPYVRTNMTTKELKKIHKFEKELILENKKTGDKCFVCGEEILFGDEYSMCSDCVDFYE